MPTSSRPRYDRQSLTIVALDVFRQRGYDATSMEQLAAAAGISKAAIYHHVSGKEELLDAGLSMALDALEAVLGEEQATTGAPVDRVRHVMRRVVELEVELLAAVSVLLRARGNSAVERRALDRRRRFDRAVARLIAQAQSDGSLRDDIDPVIAARLAIGTATWLVEWYGTGGKLGVEALADAVVTMTFDGLAIRTPPHTPATNAARSKP